jgi:L-arabinose isomerase
MELQKETVMNQLQVGFFSVGLDTYWPQFEGLLDRLMGCHRQIIQHLDKENLSVSDAGMVDSSEKSRVAIQVFKKGQVDFLIVNIATYGLSKLVLPVVKEMNVPTLVLCLQPSEAINYDYINSLGDRGKMTGEWLAYCQACVAPELGGVFAKSGIPYRLVTGHLNESTVWEEMNEWITAAQVVKALKSTRVGIMGHYYDGMLDVYSDLSKFTSELGTEFVITEFGELKHHIETSSEEEVRQKISEFSEAFVVSEECSDYEMDRAAKTSLGLDKLVDQYDLGAFAYYFEGKGDPQYENLITSVIPGFTLMTARHIPVAGEYEIKNVHAMKIMDLLGAGGSFLSFTDWILTKALSCWDTTALLILRLRMVRSAWCPFRSIMENQARAFLFK